MCYEKIYTSMVMILRKIITSSPFLKDTFCGLATDSRHDIHSSESSLWLPEL